MHELIMPSAASGSLAASSWVFADEASSGTIAALDVTTVTLTNGNFYYLPLNFTVPAMNVGDPVNIKWKFSGGRCVVTDLSPQ